MLRKQRDTLFNSTDRRGKSLLHLAVEWKNEEIIEWLLNEKDFDINVKDIVGKTPLGTDLMRSDRSACAARLGDERIFLKLLHKNAEIDQTCFAYVCREFCSKNCKEVVDTMLNNEKIKLNGNEEDAEKPIHCAAVNNRENRIEGLYGAMIMVGS